MQCPECNRGLEAVREKYVSEENSTDVFVELNMYCRNPKCSNFCGNTITESSKVTEIVRNKVN